MDRRLRREHPSQPHKSQGDDAGWRLPLAAFLGGSAGTALRLTLDAVIPHGDAGFPLSTLLINIVGSFALGYLVAGVWAVAPAWLRISLGPGLVGGFTTFSAVIVSLISLTDAGEALTAVLYLVVTLLLGFTAATAGLVLGRVRPLGRGRSAR